MIQIKPAMLTRKLYASFKKLGEQLARQGEFDQELIAELSKPEWLSPGRRALHQMLRLAGKADFYWDGTLKKNKVFHKKHDKPYSS